MDTELTCDAFLGGRLQLWQPRSGYRAGVDPVLLAASVSAKPGQTVLDLGCGVGTAALCLGARVPDLRLLGVERAPVYADLARRNGLDCRTADLAQLPGDIRHQSFDHILANPPYFDRARGHAAPDPDREAARGVDTPLQTWLEVAARRLKPKGYLHLIHQAAALPDLLAAASPVLGALEVLPIAARAGRAPDRVILRARKEGRAPFRLHAALILHAAPQHDRDGEDYRPAIKAALRDGALLEW